MNLKKVTNWVPKKMSNWFLTSNEWFQKNVQLTVEALYKVSFNLIRLFFNAMLHIEIRQWNIFIAAFM